MNSGRKIKISRIEDKMIDLGCATSIAESISNILAEIIRERCTFKVADIENLSTNLKK